MCPAGHPYARDGGPGFVDDCVKTKGYAGACTPDDETECLKCFSPTCIDYDRKSSN